MFQRCWLITFYILTVLLVNVSPVVAVEVYPADFEADFEITSLQQPVAAPEFKAVDMEGKVYRLADFRNRIVIINFWATWCLPCIRELPSLEKLRQMLPAEKFAILAINVKDSLSRVQIYLSGKQFLFKVLLDTEGSIYKAYGVKNFPMTMIIGRDGQLLAEISGERDWAQQKFVNYLYYLYKD
ncbi:MAG: TlpA family protein disulfide reductase [SAR324 cluster bacterium]|nr:TlpA family protein disulfide reductase [SAR324 cluster bacterium]